MLKPTSLSFRFSLRQTSATRASLINSGLEDNSILIPASSQGYCVLISKSWRVWAEHYKDRAGIQISFLRLKQQPIGLGWAEDCRFLAGYKNTIKIIGHWGGLQIQAFIKPMFQHHIALASIALLSLCEIWSGQLKNCHSWRRTELLSKSFL